MRPAVEHGGAPAERSFRALGSDCRVVVVPDGPQVDGDGLIDLAVAGIEIDEQRWSRFRADSELSRLNEARSLPVSPETVELVGLALAAHRHTGGLVDPTVLPALEAAGYRRSFDEIPAPAPDDRPVPPAGPPLGSTAPHAPQAVPSPGPGGIDLDPDRAWIGLPPGVHLDLGGIAKGHIADRTCAALLAAGAAGACVDLGGDVRVAGRPPSGDAWAIAVADPWDDDADLAVVDLATGAVATSSRLRRRWATTAGPAHHLIDPATGAPSASTLVAVTVLAADACWAEVYAKAALLAGDADGVALLADADLAGLLVTEAGAVLTAGPIDRFLRPPVAA